MKFWIIAACVAALCAGAAYADGDEQNAVELTSSNFDEAIQKNNYFVKFFAPWCGHCKRLAPLWEELAGLMNVKDDAKVIIGKVDCTQEQDLCAKHQITGYPTLRFFKLGESESVRYKGSRDMPGITEFINQQLATVEDNEIPSDEDKTAEPAAAAAALVDLTEENFASHVSSGNHFVKFYAPWCSHCQRLAPTWDELAQSLKSESTVSIAKIDCTLYRSICQDFEVKGYPTLLWIEDGKKIEKYSGSRDMDALKAYVHKMLGADASVKGQASVVEPSEEEVAKLKVKALTADDFEKTVGSGVSFVKFYAPWCGHCQELAPTWDKLAEKLHATKRGITIAKVDCTEDLNRNLCVQQQVEGYPTLFAYKDGVKQSEYEGSRAIAELEEYIGKFVVHDEL